MAEFSDLIKFKAHKSSSSNSQPKKYEIICKDTSLLRNHDIWPGTTQNKKTHDPKEQQT